MIKINSILTISLAMVILASCTSVPKKELTAEEKAQQAKLAATLPFEVQIDGQKAQPGTEFCAKIANPVKNSAEILLGVTSKDVIVVTLTPGTPQGLVKGGKKPAVLLIEGKSTSLDKTNTGKKLKPGLYIMRINADNKIASVLIEVEK